MSYLNDCRAGVLESGLNTDFPKLRSFLSIIWFRGEVVNGAGGGMKFLFGLVITKGLRAGTSFGWYWSTYRSRLTAEELLWVGDGGMGMGGRFPWFGIMFIGLEVRWGSIWEFSLDYLLNGRAPWLGGIGAPGGNTLVPRGELWFPSNVMGRIWELAAIYGVWTMVVLWTVCETYWLGPTLTLRSNSGRTGGTEDGLTRFELLLRLDICPGLYKLILASL